MFDITVSAAKFLSTPSARRATVTPTHESCDMVISIHALREEGDRITVIQLYANISFLSTPSARRATPVVGHRRPTPHHFYPRPPRGGRRRVFSRCCRVLAFLSTPSARRATGWSAEGSGQQTISIHALREEGDAPNSTPSTLRTVFLSTPSARRATAEMHCLI